MSETPSTIRVLIAEDDALTRSTMTELLTSLGHMVVAEVGSGAEAIENAKQLTPDVVLLDVHMPGSGGVQAAEEIASTLPGTAVILITGDLSVTLSASEVAKSGAVALLSKPAPPGTIDTTLRLAVSRARELLAAKNEAVLVKQQLEARKVIERAKGILMRRTGSSEQEAYRIMQRSSQDRSVPMVDIAKAVIDSEPGAK
ncbi:MAG: response regulator [Phycisphaerae bacterium]|nr:response regulator [Gemmatimonadaceae bacterium]